MPGFWRLFSIFSLLVSNYVLGANYEIRWGTDAGPDSPIVNGYSGWTNNPSPVQLLKDFSGTELDDTTYGPDTHTLSPSNPWDEGDLIELGFFADLGDDGALGGSGSNADSASTTLFSGSWVPITSETYIGQDFGDGSPAWETVPAGEFAFSTQFANDGSWDTSAVSNQSADTAYQIQTGDDTPTNLTTALALLSSGSTPLGIRFYDSTAKSEGVTSFNTIMNSNWTWPSAGSTLEMTLHTDTASANNLDSNLRFEFDNTNYGTNNGSSSVYAKKTTNDTAVSTTAIPGTATNPTADDFVTTITYISDTYLNSNNLDLSDSAGKGSMVVNGLAGMSAGVAGKFIDGGSGTTQGEHQLTINTNTSTSFTYSGGIAGAADGSSSTDLTILKTGAGSQTLTGAINLADAAGGQASGFLYIKEGTVVAKPTSGVTQSIEYLAGDSGSTLTLDSTGAGASGKVIELGFANTSSAKTFAGNINLAGNTGGVTLDVGGGTNFDAHQIVSGSITEDGASNFVLRKTGSGKLSLNGDSSSDFVGGITIADGDGTKDGGILVAGHNNALGTGTTTIEHGKLSIGAGVTVTNLIRGEQTSNDTDKKSVIGGGIIGAAGIINNSTQIDIGSASGEIDVLSPGMAHASSMSNGTSDYQVIAGNHDNTGSDSLNLSIGTIQIDKIGLKNGGVFDWEIRDFAGDNSDGSDWDVLKFDTLDFNEDADTFDINIYSLAANGSAGGVSGDYGLGVSKTGTSGFKFMEWTGSGALDGSTGGWLDSDQSARKVTAFNVNSDNWAAVNNFYYGDWSVWYEGGSFYLQYSAVPEPSTYFMVTGLLMLPGYNFLRRIRKKKSLGDAEDITDNA